MLFGRWKFRSISGKIVLSIMVNTVFLLSALYFLLIERFDHQVQEESRKIAISEVDKIASSIAYPLWYLDSAHVQQILDNGIKRSEMILYMDVKTQIANRHKQEVIIESGSLENSAVSYQLPITFATPDSTQKIGHLKAAFASISPRIKTLVWEQYQQSTIVIIIFISILTLSQLLVIRAIILRPLKTLKNSTELFKQTGVRKRIEWNTNDEFGDFIQTHNQGVEYGNALEAQLSEAKDRAEASNQAKSIFLSHMSHELRTPLTAILGYTNILQGEEMRADHKEYIQTISNCGDHLLNLINNILTISKIESGKMEVQLSAIKLRDMIEDVTSILEIKAKEKSLDFNTFVSDKIPEDIKVDENKIKQILFNIIGNAIKFTDEGEVTLEVFEKLSLTHKHFVEFRICDTGKGIPSKDLETIFEPFKQTEVGVHTENSTGLGLPICKDFVDLMGGHISAKNRTTSGSCFTFTVPLLKSLNENKDHLGSIKKADLEKFDFSNTRLLIVEDNMTNIQLIQRLLSQFNFKIDYALNGKEGVKKYSEAWPQIIMIDKNMPIMDGPEAIKEIRAIQDPQNIPIIVAVSADVFMDDVEKMTKSGANMHLRKPFNPQEFLKILYQCGKNLNLEH